MVQLHKLPPILTMASSAKFNFPFGTLTPINGKPTNTTLQVLQRQLFTNARSVPSARGGGLHGHLAIYRSRRIRVHCSRSSCPPACCRRHGRRHFHCPSHLRGGPRRCCFIQQFTRGTHITNSKCCQPLVPKRLRGPRFRIWRRHPICYVGTSPRRIRHHDAGRAGA